MPETFREYPVREITLSVTDENPLASGHERKMAGDIISCYKPGVGTGRKVVSTYLILRVEGFERSQFDRICQPMEESAPDFFFDKRRYCIPFERLKIYMPRLDLDRVRDPDDIYQPFVPLDEDTLLYIEGAEHPPISVVGLVFDKKTGMFL